MPELPEVQTVIDTLLPRARNAYIVAVSHVRADVVHPAGFDLPVALTGRTIRDITRRGKRIVFVLDDGNRFYIHLGMTGRLTAAATDRERALHTHLVLAIRRGATVGEIRFCDPRRFGGIFWLGCGDAQDADMGPDSLQITPAQLLKRLSASRRPVKNALMDQSVLAGLGNIYVDESLFAAGIHPETRTDSLAREQVALLCRSIRKVLRRAIRHRGSTLRDYRDADGTAGGFQKLHRVYGREGEACHICRSAIQRIVMAGRSTHFCPACQPAPRRAPVRSRTRADRS